MRIAAALACVVLIAGCGGAEPDQPVENPVTTTSAARTPTPGADVPDLCPTQGEPTTAKKDVLPNITLHCLASDDQRSLRELTGRPLVLNVWASWCGPCRVELPLLARAHEQYGDAVAFVGIDVQDASAEAFKVLQRTGVTYPQLEDPEGSTRGPLGWNAGLPMTIFVDPQGRMVATERKPFRTYAEVTAALTRHLGVSSKGA